MELGLAEEVGQEGNNDDVELLQSRDFSFPASSEYVSNVLQEMNEAMNLKGVMDAQVEINTDIVHEGINPNLAYSETHIAELIGEFPTFNDFDEIGMFIFEYELLSPCKLSIQKSRQNMYRQYGCVGHQLSIQNCIR